MGKSLYEDKQRNLIKLCIRVETGSGHPGHILFGSCGSDPVYKISWSDLDSALDHVD